MGTIPNSSLPFNDNAVNGDNVDANAWNQALQVVQLAINDNQSQINAIKNAQTTILVAHGVAYPTSPAPSSGQLFYRDDLSQLKMFNGTQWEDVESVVATANGLSINGTTYDISTSAVANTIALRDATGSLTAQTFNGSLNGTASNASELNNQPASYYAPTSSVVPPGSQKFTSNGTFTVPNGVTRIFVQLWGAGGGGGGAGSGNTAASGGGYAGCGGGGGGAGGYNESWLPVSAGQVVTVTVGSSGTGGTGGAGQLANYTQGNNGNPGTVGGFSQISIGSIIIKANGGSFGTAGTGGASSGTSAGTGGNGASTSNTTAVNLSGSNGINGTLGSNPTIGTGGNGAPGTNGAIVGSTTGTGGSSSGSSGTNGTVASAGGGGGAGSAGTTNTASNSGGSGGNGAPGLVNIIW